MKTAAWAPESRDLIRNKMAPGEQLEVNSYPDWQQFAPLFEAKSFLIDGTDPLTKCTG
jgi:hypothetical protein